MYRLRVAAAGIVAAIGILCWFAPVARAQGHADSGRTVQKEVFRLVRMGEIRSSDGAHLGFRDYVGSAGTVLKVTWGTLASPKKAKAELRLWLKGARVTGEGPKKDSEGHTVGERAVAIFTDVRTHKEYTGILWTKGSDYFRVDCTSPAAAVHFENLLNGPGISSAEEVPDK